MNGVSRTLLNSAPIQKMYEDTLSRNASSDMRTGAGLVGTAVSGAVKKIIKKRKVRRGDPECLWDNLPHQSGQEEGEGNPCDPESH